MRVAQRHEAGLMAECLAHGHAPLAGLGELRPVRGAVSSLERERAAVGEQQDAEGGQRLGRRVEVHEAVGGEAAPQVRQRLAVAQRGVGGARLAQLGEAALERVHEPLESRCHPAVHPVLH